MQTVQKFQLRFASSMLPELSKRYSFQDDVDALDAGKKIRSGQYTRANLETIFEWKTNGRGRSRLAKNTDEEIVDALRLAVEAKTDRAAVAVLTGLNGVQVPVASAILTAIDPERFTIIDFRALEALMAIKPMITTNFYLNYLGQCRELAKENNISLRTLDRALWQWSKENSGSATSR
jgi:hypothetical protein